MQPNDVCWYRSATAAFFHTYGLKGLGDGPKTVKKVGIIRLNGV